MKYFPGWIKEEDPEYINKMIAAYGGEVKNIYGYKIVNPRNKENYYFIFHNECGPALIYSNGEKEYWFHGDPVSVNNDEDYKHYLNLRVFE